MYLIPCSSFHALLELCGYLSRLFLFTNMASVGADSSAESKVNLYSLVFGMLKQQFYQGLIAAVCQP